ncbi:L-asparaginase [Andreprevotia lacus DSM 23236]|jgi:L-asparaginase|uniref:L-asparaginase n=1 Tax=Andreprevotia lacus DSM 23236 TaxID=1121001 RepID=A0A1W1XWQ2_9NEIS|nr:asparaginase [Andreprevotia lacus]SMC28295.1 L-asparaginase [Andreprevotia lacus DSM 23236]
MSLLVIYTGGTLGMRAGPQGLAPAPAWLSGLLAEHYPGLTVREYTPLLDSSAMGPADWNRIGSDIAAHADQFDGFVVLHGTDTLAWTASALSFMLQGLGKPVVLTGAMLPWEVDGSDAPGNVAAALALAQDGRMQEVAVVFAGVAYRGCRVRKVDCEAAAAFASPNAPALGRFDPQAERWQLTRQSSTPGGDIAPAFRFQPVADYARIVQLALAPGHTPAALAGLLQPDLLDGVVLQSFGAGNLPDPPVLLAALARCAGRVPLVNLSLCPQGRTTPGQYAAGSALAALGVWDGADMTPEAALAKLYWLAGQGLDLPARRALFERDLLGERGEISQLR